MAHHYVNPDEVEKKLFPVVATATAAAPTTPVTSLPPWLVALGNEAVTEFGPPVEAFLKKAALAAFNEIVAAYHLVVK